MCGILRARRWHGPTLIFTPLVSKQLPTFAVLGNLDGFLFGRTTCKGIAKTMFNQQTADAVCELLADGKSLRAACEELGVKRTTIHDWARDVKEFSDQYARAREIGYKLLADQILEISDDSTGDTFTDDDGNVRTDAERVARSKLRVDSRKWMLSKMLPKIYGDKLEIGSDPEKPFKLEFGWKQSAS